MLNNKNNKFKVKNQMFNNKIWIYKYHNFMIYKICQVYFNNNKKFLHTNNLSKRMI